MASIDDEIIPGLAPGLPFAVTGVPSSALMVSRAPAATAMEGVIQLMNHPNRPKNADLLLVAIPPGELRKVLGAIEAKLGIAGIKDPIEYWRNQGFDV